MPEARCRLGAPPLLLTIFLAPPPGLPGPETPYEGEPVGPREEAGRGAGGVGVGAGGAVRPTTVRAGLHPFWLLAEGLPCLHEGQATAVSAQRMLTISAQMRAQPCPSQALGGGTPAGWVGSALVC